MRTNLLKIRKRLLTKPQRKALVALIVLEQKHGSIGFSRPDVSRTIHGGCSGYPLKSMLALRDEGLVRPISSEAVELVQTEICRCGCDRWAATELGKELAKDWLIKVCEHPLPIQDRMV